jgi:hypothetical protein
MQLAPNAPQDDRHLAALEVEWHAAWEKIRTAWDDGGPGPAPARGLSEIEAEIIRTQAHTPIGLAVKVRLLSTCLQDREALAPAPELVDSLLEDLGEWS